MINILFAGDLAFGTVLVHAAEAFEENYFLHRVLISVYGAQAHLLRIELKKDQYTTS